MIFDDFQCWCRRSDANPFVIVKQGDAASCFWFPTKYPRLFSHLIFFKTFYGKTSEVSSVAFLPTMGIFRTLEGWYLIEINWSGREDLNLRPPGPEQGARDLVAGEQSRVNQIDSSNRQDVEVFAQILWTYSAVFLGAAWFNSLCSRSNCRNSSIPGWSIVCVGNGTCAGRFWVICLAGFCNTT
jgi:hypothetical protein